MTATPTQAAPFPAMTRAQLAGAWWTHCCPAKDDTHKTARPETRNEVLAAMKARGITERDMAAAAHAGGLISDEQLAGYR